MADNKDQMFTSDGSQERITRLCAVAMEAIKNDPEFLADDKIAIMIHNDITKSEWNRTEAGMGFWNFDNPEDLIRSLLMHLQIIGEQYGHKIGTIEVQAMPDLLDPVIREMMARIAEDLGGQQSEGDE